MAVNAPEFGLVSRGILSRITGGATKGAACPPASHDAVAPNSPVFVQGPAQATGKPAEIGSAPAPSMQSRLPRPQPLGGSSKRVLDLMVAFPALVLAAPLMLIIALLIKITTGGPVLFAHRRIGFDGMLFDCYKFRTMAPNSEQVLQEYLAENPEAEAEWREHRKLVRDPRITLLGRVLRKSSLDELPQLFNILRGEMSCVGPRPVVAEELQQYGAFSNEYLRAKPGLTGLWQISGRTSTGYTRRVLLDAQYVQNWSLRADIVILAWTTIAVMRFEDAS